MDKKILIVDDEKDAVSILEMGLKREGYVVISAYGGIEAKNKIIAEKPDVVVLDLMMPDIDGWDVLKWMREEEKLTTPAIIVSARDEMSDIKKGYSLKADTYLTKPISVHDLLRGIRAVCSLKPLTD